MKASEFKVFIKEIEEEFPVSRWSYKGEFIWPLIRVILIEQFFERDPEENKTRPPQKQSFQRFKKAFYWLTDIFRPLPQGHHDVLCVGLMQYRSLVKGELFHRFLDPIKEASRSSKLSVLHLEFFYENFPTKLIHGFWSLHFLDFHIRKWRKTRQVSRQKPEMEKWEEFKSKIKNISPKAVSHLEDSLVVDLFERYMAALEWFGQKIPLWSPKVIFVNPFYSVDGFAICSVAKKLGIRTVDVQHGLISGSHMIYSNWYFLPPKGYQVFPDYIWVWSDFEKTAVKENAGLPAQVYVGGNPWLEYWPQLVKNLPHNPSKKTVLFTTQPIQIFQEGLPKELVQFIKSSPKEWTWLIRLHPNQLGSLHLIKEQVKREDIEAQVQIERPTRLSLPEVLWESQVHITYYSTVILEAEQFGLKSFAISEMAINDHSEAVKKGEVELLDLKDPGSMKKIEQSFRTPKLKENNLDLKTKFQQILKEMNV